MHSGDITIESVTKIEGSAGVRVTVENDQVTDLKFIIQDYRRFYTEAVKGKPIIAVPSFLSRICGTCSVAHLFAAIIAIEKTQGIEVSEQTKLLRRLAYNGLMIRDHALHLYFFTLPDVLGVDSILDIKDDDNDPGHILLHDSFDIKRVGTEITNIIIGAAIHAPLPTPGGFLRLPDQTKFPELIEKLEKVRSQVIRGVETFYNWKESLIRNSDYLAIRNDTKFDFLEGNLVNTGGKKVNPSEFLSFMKEIIVPYSQSKSYIFSDTNEDFLVGALARINFNKDLLNERTKKDIDQFLNVFPSSNIYHNNLAQAVEILQCVDDSIEILKNIQIVNESPVRKPPQAGIGIGVIEAPRGTLYHMAKTNDKGVIIDYDVIVPTSQNQITIENDLKKYFNENLANEESYLKVAAEKIVRAYDPCMSCATNFLKIDWIRK